MFCGISFKAKLKDKINKARKPANYWYSIINYNGDTYEWAALENKRHQENKCYEAWNQIGFRFKARSVHTV